MSTKKCGPHDSRPVNLVSGEHRQNLPSWTFDKKLPLVSIVIPTYNRARWLRECIESALGQDYPNLQVLVVDDGSTDETSEIMKGFHDPRLRYIRKEHTGGPGTRNHGILCSQGDFIVWLGSDDVLLPHTVEKELAIFDRFPRADVAYGDRKIIDVKGKETGRVTRWKDYWGIDLIPLVIWNSTIPDGGSMVRKSLYEKCGLYDGRFLRAHDHEFWSRVAEKARFKHCGYFTYKYRIHDSNISGAMGSEVDTSYNVEIMQRLLARYSLRRLFPTFFDDDLTSGMCRAYLALGTISLNWKDAYKGHDYFQKALPHLDKLSHSERTVILPGLLDLIYGSYIIGSPYCQREALAAARRFPRSLSVWRRLAMTAIPEPLRAPLERVKEKILD